MQILYLLDTLRSISSNTFLRSLPLISASPGNEKMFKFSRFLVGIGQSRMINLCSCNAVLWKFRDFLKKQNIFSKEIAKTILSCFIGRPPYIGFKNWTNRRGGGRKICSYIKFLQKRPIMIYDLGLLAAQCFSTDVLILTFLPQVLCR